VSQAAVERQLQALAQRAAGIAVAGAAAAAGIHHQLVAGANFKHGGVE
jgi:hypothetical protein